MRAFILSLLASLTISYPIPTRGDINMVRVGIQVLRDNNYADLVGQRVAILSNPTGVFPDSLRHIVDVTAAIPGLNIVGILGPEHGFRGELQAETGDPLLYTDTNTGLPVYSVYKMNQSQIEALLIDQNITTVLVDMQDVGVRLYTFQWTMYNVMNAASALLKTTSRSTRFVVCDRPNPLGGVLVDGPMLNMSCCASGYGKAPIPHIHGMTIGELSLLFNAQFSPSLPDLRVIAMDGWKRDMTWAETRLPWVPPSPNVPTIATTVAYGATCFLEATTIAEGRGTTTPFEIFGAPFLSSTKIADTLNSVFECSPERRCFRAAYFQPTFSKYNGTAVPAAQWLHERTDLSVPTPKSARALTPFAAAVHILVNLRLLSTPIESFVWDGSWFGHPGTELIDTYAGTPRLREMIDAGVSASDIIATFAPEAEAFRAYRAPYLLY